MKNTEKVILIYCANCKAIKGRKTGKGCLCRTLSFAGGIGFWQVIQSRTSAEDANYEFPDPILLRIRPVSARDH